MTLKEIGEEAHAINANNGWEVFKPHDWPGHSQETRQVQKCCAHMALVHTEVSEATEAIRKIDFPNFREELADIIIRVASIAHGLGISLDDEVDAKLVANTKRGLRHGGKAI